MFSFNIFLKKDFLFIHSDDDIIGELRTEDQGNFERFFIQLKMT